MIEKHSLSSYPGGTGKRRPRPAAAERRNNLRWVCSATVQVIETRSGVKMNARTADLGLGGCYIDTVNTFAAGTPLRLRITLANQNFETEATVMYALPGMGMGLGFTGMVPQDHVILQKWAKEMQSGSSPSWEAAVATVAAPPRDPDRDRQVVNQLIKLLLRKEILSEDEASSLLD